MGRMFYFWGKMYRKLIGHLIFVWLTLLVFGTAILGVYFWEQKTEDKVNKMLSESPLVLYLSPKINTEKLTAELKKNILIKRINLTTGSESMSALEKEFGLNGLQKWASGEKLFDFLVIYLDGGNFTKARFQKLVNQFSVSTRIKALDYNAEKIRFWGRIKSLLIQFRIYPIIIIILVGAIQLFLLRRLMRNHQKKCWADWSREGLRHLYKLSHLLIEIVILLIGLFLGFGIPIYIWQDKLYQTFGARILRFNLGWCGVFSLIGIYIFIAVLNLISQNERI